MKTKASEKKKGKKELIGKYTLDLDFPLEVQVGSKLRSKSSLCCFHLEVGSMIGWILHLSMSQ